MSASHGVRFGGGSVRRVVRRLNRAATDPSFTASELGRFRSTAEGFAFAAATLILILLAADVVLVAPGVSEAGVAAAATAGLLVAVGFGGRRQPPVRVRPVFFVEATLVVVAADLLQVEEQPTRVLAFHLVAMVPVAVAAFARWSSRWHIGWLAFVLAGLVGIQAIPLVLGSTVDTTGQFVTSFVAGAIVSVAVLLPLRLERYRSHVLLSRIAEVNRLEVRGRHALSISIEELRQSQLTIRKLEGILPTCASCGRVRTDDDSEWLPLADYLVRRGAVSMSHGLCPVCYAETMKAEFGEG